jgi:hypothetical protein
MHFAEFYCLGAWNCLQCARYSQRRRNKLNKKQAPQPAPSQITTHWGKFFCSTLICVSSVRESAHMVRILHRATKTQAENKRRVCVVRERDGERWRERELAQTHGLSKGLLHSSVSVLSATGRESKLCANGRGARYSSVWGFAFSKAKSTIKEH